MECRLKCENPEDIVYTMTISMEAKHWETIRDQLNAGQYYGVASDLRCKISNLLSQAKKIYWPEDKGESNE